ncbi:alpha/beta fold hydrolase [Lacisediminihabitans sp. FW035]
MEELVQTPDIVSLADSLADQTLAWETCEFEIPLDPPTADVSNVECATIEVPKDWRNVNPADTWDLRISQAKNIDATDPAYNTTLLIHPGGPVSPGLPLAAERQAGTPELRPTTNYVSFDQRGIGQSSIVTCDYEYDPAGGVAGEQESIARACSNDVDVKTITSEQTAYDMDFIRHLLNLPTVTYMGSSYGTWLGAWYGSLFSENIDRMVLDSAIDITQPAIQQNMNAQHVAYDRQFRLHAMNYIARNDATYGLGSDPEAIWDRYFAASAAPEQASAAQMLWYASNAVIAISKNVGYPVIGELVKQVIAESEASAGTTSTEAGPAAAAIRMLDKFDPTVLNPAVIAAGRAQLELQLVPPTDKAETRTFASTVDMIYCNDGEWTQGADFWNEYNTKTAKNEPLTAQLGRLDVPPLCAWWPTEQKMPSPTQKFPETIVLQSELDPLTPYESGVATAAALPNATLIAVDNEGTHGVFPYGTTEVDQPIIDFLLGGERPPQNINAPGHPLPGESSVFESWVPLTESHDDVPRFTSPSEAAEAGTPVS